MTSLAASIEEAAELIRASRRPWALVGGLAVGALTEPRFTRDVDLAIAVSDDVQAEALVSRFLAGGFEALALLEQESTSRLATVRMRRRSTDPTAPVIDLLFATCGIEAEIVAGARMMEVLPGVSVPVPRVGHLLAMKILARDDLRRPQDRGDIAALLAVADAAERIVVR